MHGFVTPNVAELEGAVDRCGLPGAGPSVDGAGRPYFADRQGIRRIEAMLPEGVGGPAIASADGSEVWVFDGAAATCARSTA